MLKRILLKITSVKNLLLFWSIFLITYIVMKNRVDFNNLAMFLIAVPIAYLPANILAKLKNNKTEE